MKWLKKWSDAGMQWLGTSSSPGRYNDSWYRTMKFQVGSLKFHLVRKLPLTYVRKLLLTWFCQFKKLFNTLSFHSTLQNFQGYIPWFKSLLNAKKHLYLARDLAIFVKQYVGLLSTLLIFPWLIINLMVLLYILRIFMVFNYISVSTFKYSRC